MKQIQLWSVHRDDEGPSAAPVSPLDTTETEAQLDDLLVRSPALLAARLKLIGRQIPTEGGSLDLLGVDEDGRLVVFELKKGTLTREAVAQVLDYASDLADSDAERLIRLVQDYSGRLGIEKIEDFEDWYAESFPNSSGILAEVPKMVLVGLGVDDCARRIVNFLADTGVDIELLTFHAFESNGKVLLARQVESVSPVRPPRATPSPPTKEGNLQILRESARSLGVLELLEEVARFIADTVPGYKWPGKTAYSFSLPERTAEGNPTLRSYMAIYLDQKQPGSLKLILYNRAVQCAPTAVEHFRNMFPKFAVENARYHQLEIALNRTNWIQIASELKALLSAIVTGAKTKAAPEEPSVSSRQENAAV